MSESEHTPRHPHCITCGGYHEGDFCDTPPIPAMIKVGAYVNCPDGLGKVSEIKDGRAKVYIQSFGVRTYKLSDCTLRGKHTDAK